MADVVGGVMLVEMEEDKETKGTWRFAEVVPDDGVTEPSLPSLYLPKRTLRELGWAPGKRVLVKLEVA